MYSVHCTLYTVFQINKDMRQIFTITWLDKIEQFPNLLCHFVTILILNVYILTDLCLEISRQNLNIIDKRLSSHSIVRLSLNYHKLVWYDFAFCHNLLNPFHPDSKAIFSRIFKNWFLYFNFYDLSKIATPNSDLVVPKKPIKTALRK